MQPISPHTTLYRASLQTRTAQPLQYFRPAPGTQDLLHFGANVDPWSEHGNMSFREKLLRQKRQPNGEPRFTEDELDFILAGPSVPKGWAQGILELGRSDELEKVSSEPGRKGIYKGPHLFRFGNAMVEQIVYAYRDEQGNPLVVAELSTNPPAFQNLAANKGKFKSEYLPGLLGIMEIVEKDYGDRWLLAEPSSPDARAFFLGYLKRKGLTGENRFYESGDLGHYNESGQWHPAAEALEIKGIYIKPYALR